MFHPFNYVAYAYSSMLVMPTAGKVKKTSDTRENLNGLQKRKRGIAFFCKKVILYVTSSLNKLLQLNNTGKIKRERKYTKKNNKNNVNILFK